MIIPVSEIATDTLMNIIEGFVLREGTEYGSVDCDLADKVDQVLQQLKRGEALLVYSELHESVNIVPKDQLAATQEEY
ncbi:YheU family protein [Paraglaciecola sp.]|uniref:YheU family protein n=1 Tax=Paraglaciecola sp. TaxID=1920173 RepID=UPI003EF3651B